MLPNHPRTRMTSGRQGGPLYLLATGSHFITYSFQDYDVCILTHITRGESGYQSQSIDTFVDFLDIIHPVFYHKGHPLVKKLPSWAKSIHVVQKVNNCINISSQTFRKKYVLTIDICIQQYNFFHHIRNISDCFDL